LLAKLQRIRSLLANPNTANIRTANEELQNLALVIDDLVTDRSTTRETIFDGLSALRSELSIIGALSQNALQYFHRLAEIRASKFGAYERTGEFRIISTPLHMSVEL